MVSGLSQRNSSTHNKLPYIGKWLAIISVSSAIIGLPLFIILDPLAIFNGFFTILSGQLNILALLSLSGLPLLLLIHLVFPGVWCAKLCPLGGLQILLSDIKTLLDRLLKNENGVSPETNSGRRYFLMSGAGILAGAMIPRLLKPASESIIRPPAAVDPLLFNSLCCRCGNCNKACPTGIIVPLSDYNNIMGWMTPEIVFKDGYCLETCNLCSQVCPTGAITLFSVKAKSQLFMGTAKIQLQKCLLVHNTECVKCKDSCKYDAIEFVAEANILNMIPVVNIRKCVGCGACEVVCPVSCIVIEQLHLN
jgi:ferredoxin-type protein NapF